MNIKKGTLVNLSTQTMKATKEEFDSPVVSITTTFGPSKAAEAAKAVKVVEEAKEGEKVEKVEASEPIKEIVEVKKFTSANLAFNSAAVKLLDLEPIVDENGDVIKKKFVTICELTEGLAVFNSSDFSKTAVSEQIRKGLTAGHSLKLSKENCIKIYKDNDDLPLEDSYYFSMEPMLIDFPTGETDVKVFLFKKLKKRA